MFSWDNLQGTPGALLILAAIVLGMLGLLHWSFRGAIQFT